MIGGFIMNRPQHALTDLPGDLGRKIFEEILSSEIPSRDEMEQKAREIEYRVMREERDEKKKALAI